MKFINLIVVFTLACLCVASRSRAGEEMQTPQQFKRHPALQDVWSQILKNRDDLEKTVATKRLGMVEIYGFRIAGLANKLAVT